MEELIKALAVAICDELEARHKDPPPALYMSRQEIAQATGFSPGTVTKIIKEMEQDGYKGIWRSGRNVTRVNYNEFQEYMETRR